MSLRAVDLFSGCGGLSRGFEDAGISVELAFDNWRPAIETYQRNFKHDILSRDLSNPSEIIPIVKEANPDLIIGGPPCQDFSNAGKREEKDRADLTFRFAQVVAAVKPAYFVMENVPRAQRSNVFSDCREVYKEAGYGLTEIITDSSDFGVAQFRQRFICIGVLGGETDALLHHITSKAIEPQLTVREYLENEDVPVDFQWYYRHPTTYQRRAVFSVDETSPTIRGVDRPMPQTYKWNANDAAAESERDLVVRLNPRLRALIQSFPKDFVFPTETVGLSDINQVIGNAVPVKLAEAIASSIVEFDNCENMDEEANSFLCWLRDKKGFTDRKVVDFVRASHGLPPKFKREKGKKSLEAPKPFAIMSGGNQYLDEFVTSRMTFQRISSVL